jgi:protein SCO1/2
MRAGSKWKWSLAAVGVGAVLAALVLGARLTSGAPARSEETFRSGLFDPPRVAPELDLEGSNGARVHLRDYAGKVVVLEFGFTFCTQVCPVTLAHLSQVFKQLGDDARDVQVVFVTVDPKRDSAERLAQYLASFHPSFVGATGTPKELQAVRDAYGIMAEEVIPKNAELGYEVNHSSFIYLVDRGGRLRALVPFGKPVDDIVNDIKFLLKDSLR